jgi:hypothetical protein
MWHALNLLLMLIPFGSTQANDAATPKINLRASTLQPYVGQLVQLTSEIDLPAGAAAGPLQLSIPWLMREFGFVWRIPPEEWLCERVAGTTGLHVQINSRPQIIHVPPSSDAKTHYELTWWLIVQAPDVLTSGRIEFAPVRMLAGGAPVTSNPLRLQVRRLPLPPSDLPSLNLNLGVGDYQLEMALEPESVSVDDPAILTLKISGEGALALLPRPALAALPFFRQTGAFFLEDSTESWDLTGKTRYFRYLLRPRRFGTVTIPNLFYTCFDPALGKYQTRVAPAKSLNVVAAVKESAPLGSRHPAHALPERLRLTRYDDPELLLQSTVAESSWRAFAVVVVAGFPLLFFLIAVALAWRDRNAAMRSHRSSAAAARQALHQLQKLNGDVSQVADVVASFLSQHSLVRIIEPESAHIDSALRVIGLSSDRADAVRQFFRECDAARFAPCGPEAAADLRALAEKLIRTMSADA